MMEGKSGNPQASTTPADILKQVSDTLQADATVEGFVKVCTQISQDSRCKATHASLDQLLAVKLRDILEDEGDGAFSRVDQGDCTIDGAVSRVDQGGCTLLHHVCEVPLPRVVSVLLSSLSGLPLINAQDLTGWTPIMLLLSPKHKLDQSCLETARCFLQHQTFNASMKSHHGETIISLLSRHLSKPRCDHVLVLTHIQEILQHESATRGLLHEAFMVLVKWKHPKQVEISNLHTRILLFVACHHQFSLHKQSIYRVRDEIKELDDSLKERGHEEKIITTLLDQLEMKKDLREVTAEYRVSVQASSTSETRLSFAHGFITDVALILDSSSSHLAETVREVVSALMSSSLGNHHLRALLLEAETVALIQRLLQATGDPVDVLSGMIHSIEGRGNHGDGDMLGLGALVLKQWFSSRKSGTTDATTFSSHVFRFCRLCLQHQRKRRDAASSPQQLDSIIIHILAVWGQSFQTEATLHFAAEFHLLQTLRRSLSGIDVDVNCTGDDGKSALWKSLTPHHQISAHQREVIKALLSNRSLDVERPISGEEDGKGALYYLCERQAVCEQAVSSIIRLQVIKGTLNHPSCHLQSYKTCFNQLLAWKNHAGNRFENSSPDLSQKYVELLIHAASHIHYCRFVNPSPGATETESDQCVDTMTTNLNDVFDRRPLKNILYSLGVYALKSTGLNKLKFSLQFVIMVSFKASKYSHTDPIDANLVRDCVASLLNFCLSSKPESLKLQQFLLGQEVREMVRHFLAVTGDPVDIYQGISMTLEKTTHEVSHFSAFIAVLVKSWITETGNTVKRKPGFVYATFKLLQSCEAKERRNLTTPNPWPGLDSSLHAVVKYFIDAENQGINRVDSSTDDGTVLHQAAARGLVQVVRLLANARYINLNALTIKGLTPLMCVIKHGSDVTDAHCDVISTLLMKEDVDLDVVSVVDRRDVLDLFFGEPKRFSHQPTVMLKIVREFISCDRMNANKLAKLLTCLMSWTISSDFQEEFSSLVHALLQHENFNSERMNILSNLSDSLLDLFLDWFTCSDDANSSGGNVVLELLKRPGISPTKLCDIFSRLTGYSEEESNRTKRVDEILASVTRHPNFDVKTTLAADTDGQIAARLLHFSGRLGHIDHLEKTLTLCDVSHDARDPSGKTFLYYLVRIVEYHKVLVFISKLEKIYEELINQKLNHEGETLLQFYCSEGNVEAFRECLDQPELDVNAVDNRGFSVLYYIIKHQAHATRVRLLDIYLDNQSVDVGMEDRENRTIVDHCLDMMEAGEDNDEDDVFKMILRLLDRCTSTGKMLCASLSVIYQKLREESGERRDRYVTFMEHVFESKVATRSISESLEETSARGLADICFQLIENRQEKARKYLCQLLKISDVSTILVDAINRIFRRFDDVESAEGQQKVELLRAIMSNPSFDINSPINKEGHTLAHVCARHKLAALVKEICTNPKFDPKVIDCSGRTPVYDICENLAPKQSNELLRIVFWEFAHTDQNGDTLLNFYSKQLKSDRFVYEAIRDANRRQEYGDTAALNENPWVPLTLETRQINLVATQGAPGVAEVKPSEVAFFNKRSAGIRAKKIYDLSKAKKGKLCIISLPRFKHQRLKELGGYDEDTKMLTSLYSNLGFEVVIATPGSGDTGYCLTATEIENSVTSFAASLQTTEQCAVLAILSHGKEGFVYGSDGNKVYILSLLDKLNNKNCKNMAGKPKIVIIQACQGGLFDVGVHTSAAPSSPHDTSAPPELKPTLSDFIVSYSTMSGFVSFVQNQDAPRCKKGSVYIKNMKHIFCESAHYEDICSLLTEVNKAISDENILGESPTTLSVSEFKQMSRFESCLTRKVYFFPAVNGKAGQDWVFPEGSPSDGTRLPRL